MATIDLQQMWREEKLKVMDALREDVAREEDAAESPEWPGELLGETEDWVGSGVEQVSRLGGSQGGIAPAGRMRLRILG